MLNHTERQTSLSWSQSSEKLFSKIGKIIDDNFSAATTNANVNVVYTNDAINDAGDESHRAGEALNAGLYKNVQRDQFSGRRHSGKVSVKASSVLLLHTHFFGIVWSCVERERKREREGVNEGKENIVLTSVPTYLCIRMRKALAGTEWKRKCDQMSRLLVQYLWPFISTKNCPIAKIGYKFCLILNKVSRIGKD